MPPRIRLLPIWSSPTWRNLASICETRAEKFFRPEMNLPEQRPLVTEARSEEDPRTKRAQTLASLREQVLDLLVIGGGIVGAGIARDAAMRGLRVGMVEQHDFAFGTSSRSSRLLHGGMRYPAQGRLGLVRE